MSVDVNRGRESFLNVKSSTRRLPAMPAQSRQCPKKRNLVLLHLYSREPGKFQSDCFDPLPVALAKAGERQDAVLFDVFIGQD